jgi:hypothetical protein
MKQDTETYRQFHIETKVSLGVPISENYKLIEGMFYNSLHRSSKDL